MYRKILKLSIFQLLGSVVWMVFSIYELVQYQPELRALPFHSVLDLGRWPFWIVIILSVVLAQDAIRDIRRALVVSTYLRSSTLNKELVDKFYEARDPRQMLPAELQWVIAHKLGVLLPDASIRVALRSPHNPLGALLRCARAGGLVCADALGVSFIPTRPAVFRLYESARPFARFALRRYEAAAQLVKGEYD